MGNLISEWIDDRNRRNKKDGHMFLEDGVMFSYGHHFPLALHVGSYILVNADRYSVTTSNHQSDVNVAAGDKGIAIPFSAMAAAGIRMYDPYKYLGESGAEFEKHLQIIDFLPPHYETMKRKDPKTGEIFTYPDQQRALTFIWTLGASLFRWMGYLEEDKWRYFISGIDNTGRTRRGNYFLTELVNPASSVDEAYEQLKPESIKIDIQEGYDVVRQGEYYFIRIIEEEYKMYIKGKTIEKMKPCILPDIGRGNTASSHVAREGIYIKDDDVYLVKGTVRHQRGDHKMLRLGEDWHIVSHNVQVQSFSANGGFD